MAGSSDAVGNFFKAMLPGQSPKQPPASSLLADWNTYQQQHDLESGTGASTSSIGQQAEEFGNNILSFFRSGYTAVSDGVSNVRAPSLETT
jgi:hypothetical protein